MKTKLISALVLAASAPFSVGMFAQTSAPTLVSGSSASFAVAPAQTIYSARLPSPQELTDAAAAQNIAIDKIDQTAGQVNVTYKFANGQTKVVSYQILPSGAGVGPASAPTTVVATPSTQAPVVVVDNTPRTVVYYSDYPGYYGYPGYYYPPVSLGIGLGFGYRGGFYRGGGGFHRGWR